MRLPNSANELPYHILNRKFVLELISYREVNIVHLSYRNQAVNTVEEGNQMLCCDANIAHIFW